MAKEKLLTDDAVKAHVARTLQGELAKRGWSQQRLADEMGEPLMTVNSAVRGTHQCRPGFIARAAIVLELSADELLGLLAREKKSRQSA